MNYRISFWFVLSFWVALASYAASPADELFRAIDQETGARVTYVLAHGSDPNALDANGETALMYSIAEDHVEAAKALIKSPGILLDAENRHAQNALMIAAFHGQVELVQMLVDAGAEINHTGWSPLHYAVVNGNEEIVRLLLENSAYIDAESPNQTTPLMLAARSKNRGLSKLLVESGADPTPSNQAGFSAAKYATAAGDAELGAWLQRRADEFRHAHPTVFAPPPLSAPSNAVPAAAAPSIPG